MINIFFVLLVFSASASFDIRQLPVSASVTEAILHIPQRRDLLLEKWSKLPLDKFPFYKSEDKGLASLSAAVARLALNVDIEAVNNYLLDPRFRAGISGTRISLGRGICTRKGDYDFVLQELLRIAFIGKNKLSAQAYKRLVFELLNVSGNNHYTKFRLDGPCKIVQIRDSENHILMTESARYLKNQILFEQTKEQKYDNEKNGFNNWILKELRFLFDHGFSEINSKPYQGYTIAALLNIYDFASDRKVKKASNILLDYLTMKFAMESIGGRRYPTFRRQYRHYNNPLIDDNDALAAMMIFWTGDFSYLLNENINLDSKIIPYGDRFALNASISNYRPHKFIYESIFNTQKSFQVYEHQHYAKQVSYKTHDYLLSGGGVHRKLFPYVSKVNDVLAAPTIIIPRRGGRHLNDFFYFLGNHYESQRSNICVGEDFICGENIHYPAVADDCKVKMGEWIFYNFKSGNCRDSIYSDLYLAVYTRKLKRFDEQKLIAKDFGLIEISKTPIDFNTFISSVLKNNPQRFERSRKQIYTKINGEKISFNMDVVKGEFNVVHDIFEQKDRVRGSHHLLKNNLMRIHSPSGAFEDFYFPH